jgi:hypothetical protein
LSVGLGQRDGANEGPGWDATSPRDGHQLLWSPRLPVRGNIHSAGRELLRRRVCATGELYLRPADAGLSNRLVIRSGRGGDHNLNCWNLTPGKLGAPQPRSSLRRVDSEIHAHSTNEVTNVEAKERPSGSGCWS